MRQGLRQNIHRSFSSNIFFYILLLSLLSVMVACSKSEDVADERTESDSTIILPEAGSQEANFVINTNGGDGGTGAGGTAGNAGVITVTLNNAKAGRLEVLDNGLANANFVLSSATTDLGDNPLAMSASQTISIATVKPVAGTPYMVDDDTHLYLATASTEFPDFNERVTGVSVETGAVVIFDLNASANTAVELDFLNDVKNNGLIKTADAAGNIRGGLTFSMKNYFATGSVSTSGNSNSVLHAGKIKLVAYNNFINEGVIEAAGFSEASSSTGIAGNGGVIELVAIVALENTGIIDASGGATNAGGFDAGNGGTITLNSNYGHLFNSGPILTMGGDGHGRGGNGGNVKIYVSSSRIGDVMNGGSIDSSGGEGLTKGGGNAGGITLGSIGGALINNASISANGGDAANNFSAGSAGNISLTTNWGDFESPPGNLIVSGNLSAMGGSAVGTLAGAGGAAGSITIIGNDGEATHQKQLLGLWGYSEITAKGGVAETPANGKTVLITVASPSAGYPNRWDYSPVGSLINEVDIDTSGGTTSATDTAGSFVAGAGGTVFLRVETNILGDTSTLNNSGKVTTTSGNNQNSNSQVSSGNVQLVAPGGVINTAAINTKGGIDTSVANMSLVDETSLVARLGNAKGNHAGYIYITSSAGDVMNSGTITASGGDAEVAGGDAANIDITGIKVNNTANIFANGGNSTVLSLFNSKGGDAGLVYLRSKLAGGLTHSATISNLAGVGEVRGVENLQIIIDGE